MANAYAPYEGELFFVCDECGHEQDEDRACDSCLSEGRSPQIRPYPPERTSQMHPKTYDVKEFPSLEEAAKAGYTEPLNPKEADELKTMNRKQRRKWLSKRRKERKTT